MDHFVPLAIAIAGGFVGVIGALIRHAQADQETRTKLQELTKRVTKLDGINGHG